MLRWNHYESAFEAYLRQRNIPYLAVEEQYRNQLGNGRSLKNLDFVISRTAGTSYLVDVKGRKFPSRKNGSYWKNWSTRDDLTGLKQWESLFGSNFSGLFVFAYLICSDQSPLPPEQLFEYKKQLYGFVGITFQDYLSEIKLLSPKWRTFTVPVKKFRQLARPFADFIE